MPKSIDTFDFLLIGGGVVGLSLAWELAQHGERVCLIDRGDMGTEASWAAAGMLPPGPGLRFWPNCSPYEQLLGLGHELHPQWHERLEELTGIDNGYRETGAIYVGADSHTDEWQSWELDYHRLDAAGLTDLEPAIATRLRALFLPSESQLRPPWHLRALVAACLCEGVDLRPGCELLDWKVQGEKVVVAVTSTGDISADNYCLTSGCWTGRVASRLGMELPIRPVRGQILLINGLPNLLRHIVNAGPRYLTPRTDGRVLVGSTQEEVGFNKQNTVAGLAELMDFASELCPRLAGFAVEKSWAGLRPGTADELPYLGRLPRFENAWIATGHFRAGIQLSPATAVVMRALMLGQEAPVDVSDLAVIGARRAKLVGPTGLTR